MSHMLGCVGFGSCYCHGVETLMVVLHLPHILLGSYYQLFAIAARNTVRSVETIHISVILALYQVVVVCLCGFCYQFFWVGFFSFAA